MTNTTVSLSIQVTRAPTGRKGFHLKDNIPTEHVEVQNFVQKLCETDNNDWPSFLSDNDTAQKIHNDFQRAIKTDINREYFRARRFSASALPPPSTELWAPPIGKQNVGRYNELGSRVLYLSRTADTAAAECPPDVDQPILYIQKFSLRLPKLSIVSLELDLEAKYPFLHYMLLDSEYVPDKANEFPNVQNPYRATHFIAHLAKINNVSAIEYPSIRGNIQNNPEAVNLVIMDITMELVEHMTESEPFLF
jgi:RES domain-containing protein